MMTVIGLMLQAVALILLFKRLGRSWLTHIGAIFIVAAVMYHGLAEIAIWIFPGKDPYRQLVNPSWIDQFVLWISVAILLFTLMYLAVLRHGRTAPPPAALPDDTRTPPSVFGWKLTLIALVPLAIISLQGTAADLRNQAAGTGFGLAEQFFLMAVVLAGFELITRFGRRWLVPVIVVQCALISVIVAERLAVFAAVGLLLYALARCGVRLSRAQVLLGGSVLVLLGVGITAARANEGRFAASADASLRFQSFIAGLASIGSPATWQTVAGDIGYRLDGNSFGSLELSAVDTNQPPLGIAPIVNDVFVAVPSFINPLKDSSDPALLQEKLYAEEHLNLVVLELTPTSWLDTLPTQLGGIMGLGGPWVLLGAALLLGALFAMADRWLLRALTPSRILVGLGLLTCVLYYERSWDTYTTTFRGIIPLLIVAWGLRRLRSAKPKPRHPLAQRVDRQRQLGLRRID